MDIEDAGMASGVTEVARAVERLVAARIGRALPFLGLIAAYGITQSVRLGPRTGDHFMVLAGALLSAGCMVAYGTEAVGRVVDRRTRWAGMIHIGSYVPYLFGGYVIVTRFLDVIRSSGEMSGVQLLATLSLILVAAFFVRMYWRLGEVHLLAREMSGLANLGSQ